MIEGLRAGIETREQDRSCRCCSSILVLLMVRSLTLPGAMEGVRWYILKFRLADLTPTVMVAAIGHAMFSLSLGGTFMVVYGSYLEARRERSRARRSGRSIGDTGSALLAGFAIIPAVFALGLEPTSGPGLIFSTLPKVFAAMPVGWLFGLLFFVGLFGAGYLSDIGAFEVLVAGLTDNTRLTRDARGVARCGGGVRARDSADDQQRDLRPVGSDVRVGDADARVAARGAHGRLVHEPLGGAAGSSARAASAPVPVWLLLLDPLRDSGGDRRDWAWWLLVSVLVR